MRRKTGMKIGVWLVSFILILTMAASVVFADDGGGGGENHAPVLKAGVEPLATGQVLKRNAYLLGDLQDGQIFTDPDGDTLDFKKNIFYQKSVDNGENWGTTQNFDADTYMTTISLTENTAGTYLYRFWAVDDKGASSADNNVYWMLTLKVVDEAIWDTSFFVGRDMNYNSNGKKYPIIGVYKTAGTNTDQTSAQYNYDYVGTFVKDGETVFVYDPADYIITGDAENGWKIRENEEGPAYDLMNYEPVAFTDSTFGEDPEHGIASGTLDNNYNMFYTSVKNGWYSYRGYGYDAATESYSVKLGGMKLKLPTDANVDGTAGGGKEIYLRLNTLYTQSKKTDSTYFTADEYHAAVICPLMECNAQNGTPYKSGNYYYYPSLLYAGGNSCLYNYYLYPDIEGYTFSQSSNATVKTGNTVNSQQISINPAVAFHATVPEEAEFGLYFQFNNFNTRAVEPVGEAVSNGDGTKTLTYHISKGNGNYTWRLEDPSGTYVTKAGWLESYSKDGEFAVSFDDNSATEKKTHDFSNLGSSTDKTDEADIQVGVDSTGYLAMDENAKKRIRAYRLWEIVNSVSANIMIEPEFHWQLLSGSADIDLVDGGNAADNWADIDPQGTAIIAVTYDAIDVFKAGSTTDHFAWGGLFPATSPNRTGVFVLSDTEKGQATAHIKHNGDGTESTRPDYWDYNYETWYYLKSDPNPVLDFTVTGWDLSKVEYSLVSTGTTLKSKMTSWKTLTPDKDGNYLVDLSGFRKINADGGTVIIRMTDQTGTSYCLARVAEAEAFAANATKPGEAIEPGDQVTLTFDGLYRALNKQAGIFNPTAFNTRYSAGETEVQGTVGQYQQLDTTVITLTVPEDIEFPEGKDETTYTFTNGYVFGQMFSAANPFRYVYEMLDTGVGTNFNATTVKLCFQRLADVPITVTKHKSVGLKVAVTDGENSIDGVALTVKDPAGKELVPENGMYTNLSYGTYTYAVKKDGYVPVSGKFTIASTDEVDGDGCVTKTITTHALAAGEWDGETMSEPAKEGDVYQIGTAEELAWFANEVNSGTGAAYNAKLTADIDLSGRNWTPIGNNDNAKNNFKGSFDGDNHIVKGLFIDKKSESQADARSKGLFGYVKATAANRASIKNLKVSGSVHVTCTTKVATAWIGGICGYANYADFENLISDVDVSIEPIDGEWNYVGGVCGYALYVNMRQCMNKGNVSGMKYVGGVAGFFGSDAMDQCANYGMISASSTNELGTCVGGIAGTVSSSKSAPVKMTNCYNVGNVSSAGSYAGGITSSFGTYSEVSDLFNVGNVTSANKECVGAFAGEISNNSVVTKAYALNNVDLPMFGEIGATNVTAEGEFVSARTLASAKFLNMLNDEGNVFVAGDNYPILAWMSNQEADLPCIHKLERHQAVAATCTEDGNKEYWTCSLCGKFFSDAEGQTEITEADTIIKAPGLKRIPPVKETCTKDGHNAYYICNDPDCGKVYKDAAGKEETTIEEETIPATGHVMVKSDDFVPATFEADGTAAWICTSCGEMFADEKGSVEISAPVRIPRIAKVELGYSATVYNGQEQKPSVTVTDADGNVIADTNYDVAYDANSKAVGDYKVNVSFKNNYEGDLELSYSITAHAHVYGEATYDWADDLSTCTATVSCTDSNCSHEDGDTVTETVNTIKTVTQEPTTERTGVALYKAVFTNELFEEQTYIEQLPMVTAAENAEKLIGALPETVTAKNEAQIKEARAAFNALSEADKAIVSEAKLQIAEARLEVVKATGAKANAELARKIAEAKTYKVKGLKVKSKNGKFKVKFQKNKMADGYQIQFRMKSAKKIVTLNTKQNKITTKNLKKGQVYLFRVRTCKKINKKIVYGQWTNLKIAVCK